MIQIYPAGERGKADFGWLHARYSFSFARWFDPKRMGFRSLRVLNEDRVDPASGFPTHPHRDMEILTYVVSGQLEHRDSMGNGSVIQAGEFQRMSAGTGVTHSEINPSSSEPTHLLQIWIQPEEKGLPPSYEQRRFERTDTLTLIASKDPSGDALRIHQDAALYSSVLTPGQQVEHSLTSGRHAWVQVVEGAIEVNGQTLRAGDGASVSDTDSLAIAAPEGGGEFLLFDLA